MLAEQTKNIDKKMGVVEKMDYEDLVGFTNEKELEKEAEILRGLGIPIDFNVEAEKWLVCAYIYGLNNGLKDYQARSFASEFVLFRTGSIVQTDVSFIYREDWLDSHFYAVSQEILDDNDGEMDDLYWARFLAYMRAFYGSDRAWHYERIKHQVNVKISAEEHRLFMSVAGEKKIDKFLTLLKAYDERKDFSFERKGKAETQLTFKVGESVYDLFMRVRADSKSARFFTLRYSFFALNE